jgi:hypothetical protein
VIALLMEGREVVHVGVAPTAHYSTSYFHEDATQKAKVFGWAGDSFHGSPKLQIIIFFIIFPRVSAMKLIIISTCVTIQTFYTYLKFYSIRFFFFFISKEL